MDFKQFLSNTQMGKVVVRFLKKEPTADAQGKMVLTAEEEQKLTEHFGPNFVSLLKEKTFSTEDEQANDLYEAALHHATEQVEARFTSQIKQLQNDIATLAAKPEDLPGATTAIEGIRNFQRGQFKADMALAHNKAAAAFLQRGVMADTPTIEVGDLRKELGPYLSQGNNLDILQQLYQGFSTSKYLTWKRAATEYKAVESESVDHVVQQFTAKWTPRGGAKFPPLTIKNFRHKVNFPVIPAEVGESWLFHLYDEGKTPDQMPITRYIVDKVMLPQIAEDIENVMISKAKYVADSQKTEDTMDGFETILVEAKKSLDKQMRFFNTTKNLLEATDDEVLTVINDFVASLAPLYKSKQMPVFMSGDVYLKYKRAYKNKWGAGSGTEKVNFGADRVDFSNCYLQVLDSLYGSHRLLNAEGELRRPATQEPRTVHHRHPEARLRGALLLRVLAGRRLPARRSRVRHCTGRLRPEGCDLLDARRCHGQVDHLQGRRQSGIRPQPGESGGKQRPRNHVNTNSYALHKESNRAPGRRSREPVPEKSAHPYLRHG